MARDAEDEEELAGDAGEVDDGTVAGTVGDEGVVAGDAKDEEEARRMYWYLSAKLKS